MYFRWMAVIFNVRHTQLLEFRCYRVYDLIYKYVPIYFRLMAAILNLRCDSCQPFVLKIHHCIVHHWSFRLLDIMMPIHSEINVKKAYTTENLSMDEQPTCADWVPRSKRILKLPRIPDLLKKNVGLRFCAWATSWVIQGTKGRE